MRMKRIGIFGGSFNPVHKGHVGLAASIVAQDLVDEVWLMVSPRNPLKPVADLWDEGLRLELARRAVADVPGVTASDFEFHLPRPSYSWATLEALWKARPECRFALVIGADNWLVFHRWARHEYILRTCELILYPREGYPVDETSLPPNVRVVHAPLFPWSSTEIRRQLRCGGDTTDMLPPAVEEYLRSLPAIPLGD